MKRMCLVGALAAGLTLTVAMAQEGPARGAGPGGGPRGGGQDFRGLMMERLLNNDSMITEIGLSTQQVAQLKTIRLESDKQMIDLNASLQRAVLNETELISQPVPNEAAVMKAVEETGKAQVEVTKMRVKSLLKMLVVLTPVQQDKVKEIFKRRMAERVNRGTPGARREGRGAGPSEGAQNPPPNPPPKPAETKE